MSSLVKVLCVTDDSSKAEFMRHLLHNMGVDATLADSSSWREFADRKKYDVLVTDNGIGKGLEMPVVKTDSVDPVDLAAQIYEAL